MVRDTRPSRDASTHQIWDSHLKYYKSYAPGTIILKSRSGQGHSDLKIVCDTPPSQDVFTHQLWNSYLKECRSYAPDSMPILETSWEVKVTVTKGWYATRSHPKMHAHTKLGIPASNNMRYAPDTNILKTRSMSQ